MNISDVWRRVAAIHLEEDGVMGAVWLAYDKEVDVVHVYDTCVFRDQARLWPVIEDGLNARGRWIPIAWHQSAKEVADKLLDRGCNILPEPAAESQAMAEVDNTEIFGRMNTDRIKVEKRLGDWLDELDRFQKKEGKIQVEDFPLMSATRHAINNLQYAKRKMPRQLQQRNYPVLSVV